MSAKRKHVVITIEQKLEAMRRIENGEILRNVAADFGVGISTVSDWVKSK
jgi:transposase